MFYHSLISDWNHGNAHFLRGVVTELQSRGHDVSVYEPEDAWSVQNLMKDYGAAPVARFHEVYPTLTSTRYRLDSFDIGEALDGADLALVHEWNDRELVRRAGEHRARAGNYRLLFHDTHHRSVTDPGSMSAYDLTNYDGVLAFGKVIRDLYLERGWAARAWTWHEAADTRIFHPPPEDQPAGDHRRASSSSPAAHASSAGRGDLVWVGNWGDEERTEELLEFLIEPVKSLKLKARMYGVRYPEHARKTLRDAGIEYAGWLPNYEAPKVFAEHKVTVHVPRRPYVESLPGIPTIRVFEALACGIPLVCSPWDDAENLFTPGKDFLVARSGGEMKRHLKALVGDGDLAREVANHGLRTIRDRHTCAHRVGELLDIYHELGGGGRDRQSRLDAP